MNPTHDQFVENQILQCLRAGDIQRAVMAIHTGYLLDLAFAIRLRA